LSTPSSGPPGTSRTPLPRSSGCRCSRESHCCWC
jgi:hypothetical protein